MKLLRLTLTNVGVVEDFSVDFTKFRARSAIAVTGPNGAGKSTVLNMIPEILYLKNPGPNSFADLTPDGGEASLWLAHEGVEYLAKLESRARPGKPPVVSAYLRCDSGGIKSPTGKQRDYKEAMAKLTPPYQIYLASAFAAQDSADDLLHMTDGEVKGVLGELLELGKLDQALKAASNEYLSTKARVDVVKKMLPDDEQAEGREIDRLQYELGRISKETDKLSEQRGTKEAALIETNKKLEAAKEDRDRASAELAAIMADRRIADHESNTIQKQLHQKRKEIADISTLLLEIGENKSKLLQLQIAASKFDKRKLSRDLAGATNELESARERYTEVSKKQALAKDKQRLVDKLEGRIESARKVYAVAVEKIKSDAACINEVSKGLLGKCELAKLAREHVEELRGKIADLSKELVRTRDQCKHLGMYELPDLSGYMQRVKKIQDNVDTLQALESKIAVTSAQISAAKNVAERVDAIRIEKDDLSKALAEVEKRINELRLICDNKKLEIEGRQVTVEGFAYKHNKLSEAVADIDKQISELHLVRRQTTTLLSEAKKREEKIAERKADLEKHIEDEEVLKETVNLLGPKGIRVLLIEGAVATIAELTNQLLLHCFGDRFSLEIATQVDRADKRGTKEVLQFVVFDSQHGREGPVSSYSGGEKVFLKEALSLALAIYAAQRSGCQVADLVRDECCGSLSETNRPAYLSMVKRAVALGGFERCLFVTHDMTLSHLADERIVLR